MLYVSVGVEWHARDHLNVSHQEQYVKSPSTINVVSSEISG